MKAKGSHLHPYHRLLLTNHPRSLKEISSRNPIQSTTNLSSLTLLTISPYRGLLNRSIIKPAMICLVNLQYRSVFCHRQLMRLVFPQWRHQLVEWHLHQASHRVLQRDSPQVPQRDSPQVLQRSTLNSAMALFLRTLTSIRRSQPPCKTSKCKLSLTGWRHSRIRPAKCSMINRK